MSASAIDVLAIDVELVGDLLTGFVRDEVRKVGFNDVVIGLSGGVDSALTTAISVAALGAEHVTPVIMPYRTSSQASKDDAMLVCEAFRLTPTVIDISPQIDAYFERDPDADRARRGNKMARERMSILYDFSLAQNALVAGT
jgi:NAD+ synthase